MNLPLIELQMVICVHRDRVYKNQRFFYMYIMIQIYYRHFLQFFRVRRLGLSKTLTKISQGMDFYG